MCWGRLEHEVCLLKTPFTILQNNYSEALGLLCSLSWGHRVCTLPSGVFSLCIPLCALEGGDLAMCTPLYPQYLKRPRT